MATIKYKGKKLKEITEPQIFDPPKKMLVWSVDAEDECDVHECMVSAIVKTEYATFALIYDDGNHYLHCAEIPDPPKPRRATNRELAKWLAQGNGELSQEGSSESSTSWEYQLGYMDKTVPEFIGVRKWDDTEWHEPTVDYMGIEEAP